MESKHEISHADMGQESPSLDELKKPLETEEVDVRAVYSAALYEAIHENKIQKYSKASLQLYFAIFIAFLTACANGYDGSLLTGILAMPHFQNTFHTGTTGSQVSLIACLYNAGQIAANPFGAALSDRYGRRPAMFVGAAIIIVGMLIISTSSTVVQFAVGRFFLGFGIAISALAAPAYVVEISPPQWRGRATGLYNCGWFGGSIPAAGVTFGCNYLDNNFSWRIPLILQAFACTIILVAVFFIPESPRWLMANGKRDEAYAFLAKYHGGGDMNAKLVQLEIAEFEEGIKEDGSDKTWWDYRVLANTHSARWRTLQVVMMSIAGQYSGNGLAYFNTVIYEQLGIKSVNQQLGYNLMSSALSAVGALAGAALSDRMPRRKVLVWGTLACAGWLAINAGLQSKMDTGGDSVPPAVAQAALAAYILFQVNFMFAYTPLQAAVVVEALDTATRAKGLALGGLLTGAMGFLNQFAGPLALESIGYKYVYVFVGWDTVEAGLWYLFGVESQGRTLEELEWVYQQPNPVKASTTLSKVAVRGDGGVRVLEEP